MWNGGWHGWFFFGPIMMIVFIAVAVVVIVLLMRGLGGHSLLRSRWRQKLGISGDLTLLVN